MKGFVDYDKDFGFYCEINGKLLEGFYQGNDMI